MLEMPFLRGFRFPSYDYHEFYYAGVKLLEVVPLSSSRFMRECQSHFRKMIRCNVHDMLGSRPRFWALGGRRCRSLLVPLEARVVGKGTGLSGDSICLG
jgi:hypothetical protein